MPGYLSLKYPLLEEKFLVVNKRIYTNGLSGRIRIELKLALIINACANKKDWKGQHRQGKNKTDNRQEGEAQYNESKGKYDEQTP